MPLDNVVNAETQLLCPVNVKINDPGAKEVFVVVVNEQVQRSNRAESKIFILNSQDKICNQ